MRGAYGRTSQLAVALLAEDEPESAASWIGVLRPNGWEVVWAPDDAAALMLAQQAKPDVLITDFDMPNIGQQKGNVKGNYGTGP